MTRDVSAEQFELHGDGVTGIDGNAHKILTNPQKNDRGFYKMILSPKIVGKDKGYEDLKERTSKGLKERPKWGKDHVPGFMDNEVYAIDEMPGGKMGDTVNKVHTGQNKA